MNMNEMTDMEMVEFVTSGEENCAGKNRKEEKDPKQSGIRLRKHRGGQEEERRDPYEFELDQLDDIPSISGITEAEKVATQTGAREFVQDMANEAINPSGSKEQSDVKPKKKKRIIPKKKCP
ncbi:uncharacterized protein LOC143465804 [Clavelina lepadiformis]